jgi:hypothetical protein
MTAPFDIVGRITAFEQGELDYDAAVELFPAPDRHRHGVAAPRLLRPHGRRPDRAGGLPRMRYDPTLHVELGSRAYSHAVVENLPWPNGPAWTWTVDLRPTGPQHVNSFHVAR